MPSPPNHEPPPSQSPLSIVLALFAGLVLSGVLCVLFYLSGGTLGIVLIFPLLFLVVGFHYIVWGWWLGKYIRDREGESVDDESPAD